MTAQARKMEWERDEKFSPGERWEGRLDGKVLAVVTDLRPHGSSVLYSLSLGALDEGAIRVGTIEGGKRAAQRALDRVVRLLLERWE